MHKSAYLKYLKYQKKYSRHTIDSYACDLNQFYTFCFQEGFIQFEDNLPKEYTFIRKWVAFLSDKGISSRSINRKLSTLKSFYKHLIRQRIINNNPVERLIRPKSDKKLPEFINKEKLEILFDSCIFETDYKGLKERLILELFYASGIRRAELINLKIKDVDINSCSIKVLGKRNKERIIPMPNSILNLIIEYLKHRKEDATEEKFFFITQKGKMLYPQYVNRVVKKYLSLAAYQKQLSPHILRHSFATHILNNGGDLNAVKELLGHANLSATQVYTHNTFEKLNNIYKQAHPRA